MLDVDTGIPDLHPIRAQGTDLPATVSRMSEPHLPDRVRRPAARLVRRSGEAPAAREWPDDVRVVFDDAPPALRWRPWQILGGPGTGKTSLLVDLAVHRIANGADPESVLILTHSRRAATAVREAITAGLI
ncbi:UvrD-helicase domain-containing protein, partial [Rhodococcus sp. R1101]|uniref:UvrD-helicase domain-containing protein n=1 Tax=Rhodococcus sp. R1101 TaxID=1170698 RepID=UPI000565A2AE